MLSGIAARARPDNAVREWSLKMSMTSNAALACACVVLASVGHADPIAESFVRTYARTCLKHIDDLDGLRTQLAAAPALPSDKAKPFLQGEPGTAWPVPDKSGGTFVLAMPSTKKVCLLFARKIDAKAVENEFQRIAQNAPAPLASKKLRDDRAADTQQGATRLLSYEWSRPNAPAKLVVTLSTSTGEAAMAQGVASALYVR
jgi:hypothetical protein